MDSRSSLVDLIFAKCSLVYGRDFIGRWEGLNLDEVKADWLRELGGLLDNHAAVRRALEHLPPDKAPTVLTFRALCIGEPGDRHPNASRLPAPPATPEFVEAAQAARNAVAPRPNLEWAHALRRREQACERLSITQRAMWREALKHEAA